MFWVEKSNWADFLASDAAQRSSTSICLQIVDPWFTEMSESDREIGFTLIDVDDDGAITCDELAAWWEIVREEGAS